MEYETIVIPKGTLLFRGMHSTATLTSDFAGMLVKKKFCMHENYNVFFYPFPFISGAIDAYQYTVIYVTMRDLKLVNLILPSKFNREDRETNIGGIVSCHKIKDKCGVSGRDYDPCVDYTKVPGDISGMIAIAKTDAENLNTMKSLFRQWAKYFITYKDSRNVVGVPEFILHPRIDKTPQTETIGDFKKWYSSNKSKCNYNYLHIMSSDPNGVQGLMDDFMSEGGLDLGDDEPYHLKINKKTGFFQIEEFSNNRSELIAPNLALKPTADMILKRKSLYKTISDKYPKADTIPAFLNRYYVKKDYVALNQDAYTWLTKFMDGDTEYKTVTQPLRRPVGHIIYLIEGKKYIFQPNPAGREIEKQAFLTKDNAFLSAEELVGHPINSEMSAYEVFAKNPSSSDTSYTVSDKPARHINGLLQYYAQNKGSLGASRRTTLRRRRLLKAR
jgi:hypothetical protein